MSFGGRLIKNLKLTCKGSACKSPQEAIVDSSHCTSSTFRTNLAGTEAFGTSIS